MARIRSIKPEIRRSLVVSAWPYPVRWTFVGLPGYLDDEGRGHDDPRLLKAELYPLDDDMTARKLDKHLSTIAATGPLCRYEVDGRRYLHITTWAEHQRVNRPTPSRIPPCPRHEPDVSPHDGLTEASSPRAQARVPAEQGREQGAGSREGSRVLRAAAPQAAARPLVADWIRTCKTRPPESVIGAVGGAVDQLLREGTAEGDVRSGLASWAAKGLHPSSLPSEVNAVMNASRTATAPRGRPSTRDAAVQQVSEAFASLREGA